MISVLLTGDDIEIANLCRIANGLQNYYNFKPHSDAAIHPLCVSVNITTLSLDRLAKVSLEEGIQLTTAHSEGICTYANLPLTHYLLVCAFMGLIQWRALDLNPLIKREDFLTEEHSDCLYTPRDTMQEYSLNIEQLRLCPGCAEFYHWLGTDSELVMLYRLIDFLRSDKEKRKED